MVVFSFFGCVAYVGGLTRLHLISICEAKLSIFKRRVPPILVPGTSIFLCFVFSLDAFAKRFTIFFSL